MTTELIVLLVIFQFKHFLADYPLQNAFMLGKFKEGWGFLKPLAAHCAVHSLFTLFITAFWTNDLRIATLLCLFDFVIHFTMDRIKAGPKYLGRFKDMMDSKFWWSLGLDQMVHHITHYAIIYVIYSHNPEVPFSISFGVFGVIPLVCIILTAITSVFAFKAYSEVVGLKNSTHQVQWMPVDQPKLKGDNGSDEETDDSDLMEGFKKMYPDMDSEQV